MENGDESTVLARQTNDAADSAAISRAQIPADQASRLELATRLLVGLLSSCLLYTSPSPRDKF